MERGGGFADLNLPIDAEADEHTHRERLALALRLGYRHVAAALVVDAASLGEAHVRTQRSRLGSALTPAAQRCQIEALNATSLRAASDAAPSEERPLIQHTRLTVLLDDPAHCARLAAACAITRTYELLAVAPGSERAFVSACTTLDVDIVSLDLTRRLPFRLRVPVVRAALARGVVFELCYSPALREPSARRQLLANATALVRATGGRGLLLSSGAARAFELRGPHEAANLGTLFGLTQAAAKEALLGRALALLKRAAARRAAGGFASLRPPPARAPGAAEDDQDAWPVLKPGAASPAAHQVPLDNTAPAAAAPPRSIDTNADFLSFS